MKKALLMVLALLFMVSTSSLVLADDAAPATPAKHHKTHKKHHKKTKGAGSDSSAAPSGAAPAGK